MFCDYTAGLISGFVAILIGHPLDTVKAQQQLRSINFMQAAKRVKLHRGWMGFYRGLSVPLLATGFINSIFFGVYGDVRDYLVERRIEDNFQNKQQIKDATYTEVFISGTLAGAVSVFVLTPIELIKTKLQTQMKRKMFDGPKDCVQIISKDVGYRGLFRGFVPLMYRDGLGGGAYFVAYEGIKNLMGIVYGPTSKATESIIAGGLAGITNWSLFLPFDTIKTRMQGDDHKSPHYKNMMHVAKEIHRTDGVIGIYRGFWSASARAFPVNASIFFVYEFIMDNVCNKKS